MTDGVVGLSFGQDDQLALWREIEALLAGGFTGKIILHCAEGSVPKIETHQLKNRRQVLDRRQQARKDEDRRRKE
jgi:hypothetical protein